MLLKTIHRWLERLVPAAEDPQASVARVRQLDGLELGKTEAAAPWLYPPY
jgi:hypothetical protein